MINEGYQESGISRDTCRLKVEGHIDNNNPQIEGSKVIPLQKIKTIQFRKCDNQWQKQSL